MGKVTRLDTTKTINHETGEVLEETVATSQDYGAEPPFVKVYLENIMVLKEIQGWVSKVMYELVKASTWADKGQFIIINAGYKRILAEQLNIKPQSITNAIAKLVKKEIIIKQDNGVFLLNPQYFGKGHWKHIAKIRYEVELGKNGQTIRLIEVVQDSPKEIEKSSFSGDLTHATN